MTKWILTGSVLVVGLWSLLIPMWQIPDEQAHFAEVMNYAELKRVPINNDTSLELVNSQIALGTLRDERGNNKYTYNSGYRGLINNFSPYGYDEEYLSDLDYVNRVKLVKREAAHYPPLYYVAGAFFYHQFEYENIFSRVFGVRLLSVVIYGVMMGGVYVLGKELFGSRYWLVWSLLCWVGFWPMLTFVGSGVNNDILVFALATWICVKSVQVLKRSANIRDVGALLLLYTLGILSKQLIYPVIIVSLFALGLSVVFFTPKIKVIIIFAVASAVLIMGYGYFQKYSQGFWVPFWPNVNHVSTVAYLKVVAKITEKMYRETLPWYMGVYKWLGLVLPLNIIRIIKVGLGVGMVGAVVKLVQIRKMASGTRIKFILPWMWICLANLIYLMLLVGWEASLTIKQGFGHGLQGRYFFPLIGIQMALVVGGWWQLLKKFITPKWFISIIFGFITVFNGFSLSYVLGAYYHLSSFRVLMMEISQYKPEWAKWPIIIIPMALVGWWWVICSWKLITLRSMLEGDEKVVLGEKTAR